MANARKTLESKVIIGKPTHGADPKELKVIKIEKPKETKKAKEIEKPKETEKPKPLSIDERVSKVENLFHMVERRKELFAAKRKLDVFKFEKTDIQNSVTFYDSNGNEFKTSNSFFISKMIKLLYNELTLKIEEVEKSIAL